MPKKLYTPEQRKEKQRERARNYQKRRTIQKRIIRYSCFLIQQGYTIIKNEQFDKIQRKGKRWFQNRIITLISCLIFLILLIIK